MLKPNGRGSDLMKINFVGGWSTEIIVDSGAKESVRPWDWRQQFGCKAKCGGGIYFLRAGQSAES
eukprot:2713384-Karenia_brevis.AAC.1